MGIFFFLSIFWPGSYSCIWESPRSSMWNVLNSLAHGVLKIKVVSSDTAFKSIILFVTYVPKLQTEHAILSHTLAWVLGGIIYPWLRWIIYGNMWVSFLFFLLTLPGLDYRQSLCTFLSDFRAQWLLAGCLQFTLFSESQFPGCPLRGRGLDLPGFSLGLA